MRAWARLERLVALLKGRFGISVVFDLGLRACMVLGL